ncbi:hypothetical protein HID58_061519 [Brassica napus]|uniref:Uncharacterized protein n=1 Tax=Brassica napus TaxID=3708 RepID=A0ABQ7ZYZ8_BRANA|nr:hypothetical protein HID58_061519 [Brassica napus]
MNSTDCTMLTFDGQRWMSLMVSPSWHTNWLEEIYNSTTDQLQSHLPKAPSPYLCLPLMSIAKIAQM